MTCFTKLYQHVMKLALTVFFQINELREIAMDESCIVSQKQEFQRECFCIYDKLKKMRNRSEDYSKVSEDFGFLSGPSLQKRTVADLENCVKDLGNKYSRDVDTLEIAHKRAA
ncbi:unnamed protein product [Psylliodes chrysocephalus]|uniref:Uncharacterized protein n=1 Tax=Psylliodes chrysocephalus TaxID=3402493 RepID=A0A9P0D9V1_9CUCU|nr:unnamed protein product [Psylliodes chrysocephala]